MNCPANWEYKDVEGATDIVRARCTALVARAANLDAKVVLPDTRPTHGGIFEGLHPPNFPRFAGAYRGDDACRCLKVYEVKIEADPRVGIPASTVGAAMLAFRDRVLRAIQALDAAAKMQETAEKKFFARIRVACALFEEFCRVHPYANGNGHIARLLVTTLLARYGHPPGRWTVEPRPPDPPYSSYIGRYRDGQREQFESFLIEMVRAT